MSYSLDDDGDDSSGLFSLYSESVRLELGKDGGAKVPRR